MLFGESFSNRPLFARRRFKDFRSNILKGTSMNPWGMPKQGLSIVPNSDSSGGIEDVNVLFGARVAGANPNFIGLRPFKPRLSHTQSRSKLSHVQNP
jgi:hypothetical protein